MPVSGKTGKKRSKSCNKSCVTVQKVVIPKGIINPDETTIIEIPCRLHKQPVVVAKRKDTSPPSGDEDTDMRLSRSRSPKHSCESFSSFHSATVQQKGECDFASPDESNVLFPSTECIHEHRLKTCLVHSMEADVPDELENKTMCLSRSRSPRNSGGSFNPVFHSSSIQQGGQCGFSSLNTMQQVGNIMQADTNLHLDETEEQERVQLQRDLEAFQKARRKLLERTTKFVSHLPGDDVEDNSNYTSNLVGRSTCESYSCRRGNMILDPIFDKEEYARQLYNVL